MFWYINVRAEVDASDDATDDDTDDAIDDATDDVTPKASTGKEVSDRIVIGLVRVL